MAGQTTLAFWQLLLLAIGPATLTAIVALLGPLLLEGRKRRAETRKTRIEKLEGLIQAAFEFDHWLSEGRNKTVFGAEREIGASPISKIQGTVQIYFPVLRDSVNDLYDKACSYQMWILDAGKKRLDGDIKNLNEGFRDVFAPYRDSLNQFLSEAAALGRKELG
jgi:hypothetical protein